MNKNNDIEIEDRSKIHETQSRTLLDTQKQLDELTKMRYRQLIDDEVFIKEKNTLQGKITQLKENLRETEIRAEKWLELTEKTFVFATYARAAFLRANKMGKAGLELNKKTATATQTEALYAVRTRLLPQWNTIRTEIWLRENWFRSNYQILQILN